MRHYPRRALRPNGTGGLQQGHSRVAIFAALAGNGAIAVTKFAAALWTGSTAMLSEAIHSAVDTTNQGLLLFGMRQARKPADETHPFGYGMEYYFWAFVVALMIFALGGIASIYEGASKISHPEATGNPWINIAVLSAAAVFEGVTLFIAWRQMSRDGSDADIWEQVRRSKDPGLFTVLVEDLAALLGIIIAFVGVGLSHWLEMPVLDGVASIAIGVLLIGAAVVLARETRSLLTGESASSAVVRQIHELMTSDARVVRVVELLTMHFGPSQILLAATVDFGGRLSDAEVLEALRQIRQRLEEAQPTVSPVFLRPAALNDGAMATEQPSPS